MTRELLGMKLCLDSEHRRYHICIRIKSIVWFCLRIRRQVDIQLVKDIR